jgi:gliding motility-associated-like protein
VSPLPVVQLGPDTFLCVNGNPILVEDGAAMMQTGLRYKWNTGDTGKTRILARNYGSYWLQATNAEGCVAADTVNVYKDCYIDVPNAFTPDGDGLNDYFFPRALLGRTISGFHMQVFNRWGQMVFETRKTDGRGWDGRFNDVMQPQGVYIYLIDAELDGKIKEKYTGNVTLLR